MDLSKYLCETEYLNFSSDEVQEFIASIPIRLNSREQAIAVYEKVRDGFLYDPYHLDLRKEALKASTVVGKKRAWCVEKAILAAACFRAFGFPARLGFGIVVNHIGTEKLTTYLRKNEIVFHGYVEVYIEGAWSKCTPAFDPRICKLSGVDPLIWNTKDDSLFQAFRGTERYMEYIHFYGEFEDVPLELMHAEMQNHYPHLFDNPIDTRAFSFHFEQQFMH